MKNKKYIFVIERKNNRLFEIRRNGELISSTRSYSKAVKKVNVMNKAFNLGLKSSQIIIDEYDFTKQENMLWNTL